jgi:serine protease Do
MKAYLNFSKLFGLCFAIALLGGCAQSGYSKFYYPHVDINSLSDVELLTENEEPELILSNDIESDTLTLVSKGYLPIGNSSFNGGYESSKNAAKQAKSLGAKIVLVTSTFTNTLTTTSNLLLPNNQTTYHSGTVQGNTTYNGGYLGSSNTNATYSGTSTTYGTKAVPITTHQRRYDQNATYFVKSTKKFKFGLHLNDLTPAQRLRLERNTGANVFVVIEGSPAFYANVLPGDVLVSLDQKAIVNWEQAIRLMGEVPLNQKQAELVVLRNGKLKTVQVNF